jgi:RNA recognition motif-containing protein
METKSDEQRHIVWVNKIYKDVTKNNIQELFEECGTITNITMCSSNRNFSYCFIEFEDETGAQNALEKNDTLLENQNLIVALADINLYNKSIKKNDFHQKLASKIDEEIKDMTKEEAYYYGFRQGKKYFLKQMTKNTNIKRNFKLRN